jgi:hypothetical protein
MTEANELHNPGAAYYRHRDFLASRGRLIRRLAEQIGSPESLTLFQWGQLMCSTRDYRPDLIVELGRARGNSTCAFLEAINGADFPCRLLSICLSSEWDVITRPRIKALVPAEWFAPLDAHTTDILTFDFQAALSSHTRVLLFWDAHGFDVAECVLGGILPLLLDKEHLAIMHDLSDRRYEQPSADEYGNKGIWKGNDWSGPRLKLGNVDSCVEQAISIVDFTTRNNVLLESADHSLHQYFSKYPERAKEMEEKLGADLFSVKAHWFWFSLNVVEGPFTFPRFVPPAPRERIAGSALGILGHVRAAWKAIRRGEPT